MTRSAWWLMAAVGCTGGKGGALDASGSWSGRCDDADTYSGSPVELSVEFEVLDLDGELERSGSWEYVFDGSTYPTPTLDLVGERVEDVVDFKLTAASSTTSSSSSYYYFDLFLKGRIDGDEMVLDASLCPACSGSIETFCTVTRE